jgi:hypothetical protein
LEQFNLTAGGVNMSTKLTSAFRASVAGVLAGAAIITMLTAPAAAIDRLLSLGEIDLRPVIQSTCDEVEKWTDLDQLEARRQSILNIQANVNKEHADRKSRFEHAKKVYWEAFNAYLDSYFELRLAKYKLAYPKSDRDKAILLSQIGDLEKTLPIKKDVRDSADKNWHLALDNSLDADIAKETVDSQVPVVLRCIEYQKAEIKDNAGLHQAAAPPVQSDNLGPDKLAGPSAMTLTVQGISITVDLATGKVTADEGKLNGTEVRVDGVGNFSSVKVAVTANKPVPPGWNVSAATCCSVITPICKSEAGAASFSGNFKVPNEWPGVNIVGSITKTDQAGRPISSRDAAIAVVLWK